MTKKTTTASNAAAAKRALKKPLTKPTDAQVKEAETNAVAGVMKTRRSAKKPTAANLEAARKNITEHVSKDAAVVNGVPCALIDNTDARRRVAAKKAPAQKATTPADGGKPEAIHAAAKKAAKLVDAPADAAVKTTRKRTPKLIENAPVKTIARAELDHAWNPVTLPMKLAKADFLGNEFLATIPDAATRVKTYHVVYFLEHWFAVIEREIKVPELNNADFQNWVDSELRLQLEDGEYARLVFSDGRRGIALGTLFHPAVLFQRTDDFLALLKKSDAKRYEEAKKQPELQPRISMQMAIPMFFTGLLGEATSRLTLDGLHTVFGSPMTYITPKGFNMNIAFSMRDARDFLNKQVLLDHLEGEKLSDGKAAA
jgi:hypothetical protein